MAIQVVDVFAGPGGLNEGFASFSKNDSFPFEVVSSIEMGAIECDTLRLRAALRSVERQSGGLPSAYLDAAKTGNYLTALQDDSEFAIALEQTKTHVHEFMLESATRDESDALISAALNGTDPWILVGGPPCQLYSLVGRARAGKLSGFEDDIRHVLYKEYLHIIERHKPDAFVMENVKGMLSAVHKGGQIFDLIQDDIARLGYELRSLVVPGTDLEPPDFVIKSNEYGIPQNRHRVILLGLRTDLANKTSRVLNVSAQKSVRDAIQDLPSLRSRLSPLRGDGYDLWQQSRDVGLKEADRAEPYDRVSDRSGGAFVVCDTRQPDESLFDQFVLRPELGGAAQHEARSHMGADVSRYAYFSEMSLKGETVRVNDIPESLRPNHKNIGRDDTPFTDRFRVQSWDLQSTTVVSHIAKDGHYFIHPDPLQSRSLTVREAARLQSFPDDYLFCGSRTQQYHQVGNAVPPLLASQIADIVHGFFA